MHNRTNSAEAATELLKRRSIRESLADWARYKGFEPAPHHQLFIREIEAFLESDDEVLLLFAPPGSAKSLRFDLASLVVSRCEPNPQHFGSHAQRRIRRELGKTGSK
jgi:hypothetical protein